MRPDYRCMSVVEDTTAGLYHLSIRIDGLSRYADMFFQDFFNRRDGMYGGPVYERRSEAADSTRWTFSFLELAETFLGRHSPKMFSRGLSAWLWQEHPLIDRILDFDKEHRSALPYYHERHQDEFWQLCPCAKDFDMDWLHAVIPKGFFKKAGNYPHRYITFDGRRSDTRNRIYKASKPLKLDSLRPVREIMLEQGFTMTIPYPKPGLLVREGGPHTLTPRDVHECYSGYRKLKAKLRRAWKEEEESIRQIVRDSDRELASLVEGKAPRRRAKTFINPEVIC